MPDVGGKTAVRVSELDVVSCRAALVVFQTRVAPTAPVPDFLMSLPGATAVQLPRRAWHFDSEPAKPLDLMPYVFTDQLRRTRGGGRTRSPPFGQAEPEFAWATCTLAPLDGALVESVAGTPATVTVLSAGAARATVAQQARRAKRASMACACVCERERVNVESQKPDLGF